MPKEAVFSKLQNLAELRLYFVESFDFREEEGTSSVS
jgi:hypothetical protein